MTGRRSITEEARKRQQSVANGPGDIDEVDESDEHDESNEDASDDDSSDRRKFTQRMPEAVVEEIDEFADAHGMSRNAAINLLAKTGLDDF